MANVEWLAIPAFGAPPRTLDDWASALADLGYALEIEPDNPEGATLRIDSLGVEGYADLEGPNITAIDFTLTDDAPPGVLTILREAANRLGWELHAETEDEDL
jgi:hypothetical protein